MILEYENLLHQILDHLRAVEAAVFDLAKQYREELVDEVLREFGRIEVVKEMEWTRQRTAPRLDGGEETMVLDSCIIDTSK